MYSVFMRANINNTNEERESFDASFFVGGGERSFFFFGWILPCMARTKNLRKFLHLQKRGHSHPKGDGDFSATSFSAPDPQADRRDRLLCVRIFNTFHDEEDDEKRF